MTMENYVSLSNWWRSIESKISLIVFEGPEKIE